MSPSVAPPASWSPRTLARAVALLFLVTIVCGIIAQTVISERLIAFGDPARTASNILANRSRYALGFSLYLIEMSAQMAQTVLLFYLLKPVNRRIATVALVFGLVGCTVKMVSRIFYLAPLFILNQSGIGALTAEQLPAVSLILLIVNDHGAGVALWFFGLETVLEGWLILRSTFLPRWLGVLTIIAGVGWLTWVSPTLGYAAFNIVALVALVGSIVTIGWLLVKGVDVERWRAVAATEAIR